MKYKVAYIDVDGEYQKYWVEATSIEDAENQVKREYWNVKEIKYVESLN